MMQISKDFQVKCDNCNHVFLINACDLDCETYSYERNMGEEIEYIFSGELSCDKCGSDIVIEIRGYEYPAGAFNYSDEACTGGEFVDEPVVQISYEFDEEYYDYAYEEYLEASSQLEMNKAQIHDMSSREFELFVADIFEKMGYKVKVTKATRDGGHDIIATHSSPIPYTLIVECKHWGESHKVDVSVVRSVFGVQTALQANKSVIVTSSKFTKDARKFAEDRKTLMTLWDIDDLLDQIKS